MALSPDGKTAALVVFDTTLGADDIYLMDVERGLRTRFTFDKAGDDVPVWSPDGQSLVFASRRNGTQAIYRKSIGGTGDVELVYQTDADVFPTGLVGRRPPPRLQSTGPGNRRRPVGPRSRKRTISGALLSDRSRGRRRHVFT